MRAYSVSVLKHSVRNTEDCFISLKKRKRRRVTSQLCFRTGRKAKSKFSCNVQLAWSNAYHVHRSACQTFWLENRLSAMTSQHVQKLCHANTCVLYKPKLKHFPRMCYKLLSRALIKSIQGAAIVDAQIIQISRYASWRVFNTAASWLSCCSRTSDGWMQCAISPLDPTIYNFCFNAGKSGIRLHSFWPFMEPFLWSPRRDGKKIQGSAFNSDVVCQYCKQSGEESIFWHVLLEVWICQKSPAVSFLNSSMKLHSVWSGMCLALWL